MKARILWVHQVGGTFPGNRLRVVGTTVVFKYVRGHQFAFQGLGSDGTVAWDANWKGADGFFTFGENVYLDGGRARCLSGHSGDLLAEKEYGTNVSVFPSINTGPVFGGQMPLKLMGLHPDDLSILWEWPDPDEEFTAHDGQLCRYRRDGELTVIDLGTLAEQAVLKAPPRLGPALHGHSGTLWCQFNLQEGGRLGIDQKTGEIAWREADPPAYYFPVFVGRVAYAGPNGMAAYDLDTGKRLWHQPLGDGRLVPSCTPAVENGCIYMGTSGGLVHVVDCQTGKLLLSHKVDVTPNAVRPLGTSRIVVGSQDKIVCLEVF